MSDLNLNELTLDNIGQWPKPVKAGMIIILSVLLVGAGYWFLVKSKYEQHTLLQNEERTLKMKFERKQHQASNLQAYQVQMQKMQDRFGTMLKQLPTENEMPGLLEDISRTGIASGLVFELFAPKSEIKHDFYIELPISIEVVGNYHQLAVFISRVAQMGRIVTLHDFTIEPASTDKLKQSGDQLVMKMTAKIYRYRTQ